MKILYLTREYPPDVYGGAGVHLEHLAREMSRLASVEASCFGDRPNEDGNPAVRRFRSSNSALSKNRDRAAGALVAFDVGLRFVAEPIDADIVHCHTWYSYFGGIAAKLAYGRPLVVTVHSLEPLRPWKREQLGRGYDLSCWIERQALQLADAVIVVSEHHRRELASLFPAVPPEKVQVIMNGIDTSVYRPADPGEVLKRREIAETDPYVLFLGRISRQKGILHYLRAAALLPESVQIVLCASAPDEPQVERDTERAVEELRARGRRVVWIREMVSREEAVRLYSGAAVFCCPSIYEPFGLINLEALACGTPVVATAVGGIPEVVKDGWTGYLQPYSPISPDDPEPRDPEELARGLAHSLQALIDDPRLREEFGRRGRADVIERFGWDRIAARTFSIYQELTAAGSNRSNGDPT